MQLDLSAAIFSQTDWKQARVLLWESVLLDESVTVMPQVCVMSGRDWLALMVFSQVSLLLGVDCVSSEWVDPLICTQQSTKQSTVTEALVLHLLLEDRGHIMESIRILVPVDRMNRNVFRSRRNESVDRSSFGSVGSLFHARGAATEKALSPIRRRVHGTTRL